MGIPLVRRQVDATAGGEYSSQRDVLGFKNHLINSNFDYWQRGTVFTNPASGSYIADRWVQVYDGSGATIGISQQTFTPGQTSVPNEPTYYFQYSQSVAGSGGTFRTVAQRIEGARTLAGKNVTLSFWAKADASRSVGVVMSQNFGTGGSPSSAWVSSTQTASLTTSWQKFSFVFAAPSILGATFGTDGNDYLSIAFNLPLNTAMTISFAQVMLNEGSFPGPYQRAGVSLGHELLLCQRYYEKSYDVFTAPGTSTANGAWVNVSINGTDFYDFGRLSFKVTKRATPSMTAYSQIGTQGVLYNQNIAGNQGNAGFVLMGTNGGRINCSNGAMGANAGFVEHWTADAEL